MEAFFQQVEPIQTQQILVDFARKDRYAPLVVEVSRRIVAGVKAESQFLRAVSEVYAVQEWVRSHVKYVEDPRGSEMTRSPLRILQAVERDGGTSGDCDDMAALVAAILESLGFEAMITIASFRGRPAERATHVFCEVRGKGINNWVIVDPSLAPSVAREMIGNISQTKKAEV